MTNFEKWKKNLKPEDMFFPDIISDCEVPKLDCSCNCPARETCPVVSSAKRLGNNMDGDGQSNYDARVRHYELSEHCRLFFVEWAINEVMGAGHEDIKKTHEEEKPITNFEKWKRDLEIDDLFSFNPIQEKEYLKLDCYCNCPAKHRCPYTNKLKECDKNKSLRHLSEDQQHNLKKLAKQCKKWFTEWADATTDEEENDE